MQSKVASPAEREPLNLPYDNHQITLHLLILTFSGYLFLYKNCRNRSRFAKVIAKRLSLLPPFYGPPCICLCV